MIYVFKVFEDSDGAEGGEKYKEYQANKWLNEMDKEGYRFISMATTPTTVSMATGSFAFVSSSITVVVAKEE